MSEYGDLTPRELFLIIGAYNDRRQMQRDDALTEAYMTAYLQRVKRMPDLKKLLEDNRPKVKQPQTPEQMFEAVKSLQAKLTRGEG